MEVGLIPIDSKLVLQQNIFLLFWDIFKRDLRLTAATVALVGRYYETFTYAVKVRA